MDFDAIVIGTSAGGLSVLFMILEALPEHFAVPVIIVQHRSKDERTLLEEVVQPRCRIRIKQADEKEKIESGTVYFAPANYHLLIEQDKTFSLSSDVHVNFSRPSIDVLFESAARVYRNRLLAIIMTGANSDGAAGMETIRKTGGTTIAQDPESAQFPFMPQAAVSTGSIRYIMDTGGIKDFLLKIG